MSDARHPADEALDQARTWAEAITDRPTSESSKVAALTSLAWSAVAFLSRDIAYQQQVAQDWSEHIEALGVKPPDESIIG